MNSGIRVGLAPRRVGVDPPPQAGRRRSMLYLTTINPTVASTGTTTRGKLFLRYFSEHYDVHAVHLGDVDGGAEDQDLIAALCSRSTVPYSSWRYFIYSSALLRAADEVMRRHPIDVIVADFEKSGVYARVLSKKYGVPYVYSSHNVEYKRYLSVAGLDPRRYLLVTYIYLLERIGCRHAAFTIAITEPDAEVFRRWVPAASVVTYPGAFDETLFHPFGAQVSSDRPIVLMVGNFNNPGNRDGMHRLVNSVLPEVVKARPDVLFRFVGVGFPDDIKHPNLESAGFVTDLLEEYRRAVVIVVPIMVGGGIKIKAVEGLALGKFVVSTPKGMEGIDYSSFEMVRVGSIKDFAASILEGIAHPAPRTTANWEAVRRELGSRSHLDSIRERIEQLLGRS